MLNNPEDPGPRGGHDLQQFSEQAMVCLVGTSCSFLIMPEYPEVLAIIFLILSGKGYNGTLESYRSLKVSFTTLSTLILA